MVRFSKKISLPTLLVLATMVNKVKTVFGGQKYCISTSKEVGYKKALIRLDFRHSFAAPGVDF